jgi:transcription antitermination factor NusG
MMVAQDQSVQCAGGEEATILQSAGLNRWHVLHTLSRQEKALSEDLARRGIRHYLPLVSKARYYGRRKLIAELPLFPGYLFMVGTVDQAYSADRTGRVAQIIPVFNQDRLNWELRNLQLALEREADLDPYPSLQQGVRVEVRSGPFKGLQGVIDDRLKRNRLILQVGTLGKAASLEIDASLLEPVE